MKRLQGRKMGGGGVKTSRTLLGETKQHASDNGQGCENSGNEEMLRETPGKITQKQYFCCLHKRHRGPTLSGVKELPFYFVDRDKILCFHGLRI